jgi:hypothetical protein
MNTWERSQVMCDEEHKILWEIASPLAVVRDNTVHRQQTPSTLSFGWGYFLALHKAPILGLIAGDEAPLGIV